MSIGLSIALAITLVVAILLIVFNDTVNDEINYKKHLANIRFTTDYIIDRDDLEQKIKLLKLNNYHDAILNEMKTDIRFDIVDFDGETGTSQIGGQPSLLQALPEAMNNMIFLSQINCKELSNNNLLPKEGMLYFFINPTLMQEGKSNFLQVVYQKEGAFCLPANAYANLQQGKPAKLKFYSAISLPDIDDDWARETFQDYKIDGYFRLINAEKENQLLGYPHSISQVFDTEGDNKVLLLQLDSDEDRGLQFGNLGRLFVFIDRQKLQAADFSTVYAYIQDYREAEN